MQRVQLLPAASENSTKVSYVWLALIAGLAHLLYLSLSRYLEYRRDINFGNQHGCKRPQQLPNRWPLGIDRLKELWDWNAKGHLLEFMSSLSDEWEPAITMTQYLMFGPRTFLTLHPKNVEFILSTNFEEFGFGSRRGVFHPLLGDGIFTQEGPAWKHSRELLRKQFVLAQYQNPVHFREHVDNLLARLPADDSVVDLQPLFFKLTLDTTTALLFGRSVYSLRAEDSPTADAADVTFSDNFNIAQEGLSRRFRIAPWHDAYRPRDFRNACSAVHKYVDDYIRSRSVKTDQGGKAQEEQFGFIDQVARESANPTVLRDQLINVLLAGRDTTACCLSWTMRLLLRHPAALTRLRAEMRSVMGTESHPSREHIQKMPFLRNVIRESLRLYPPVPLNQRTALRTTMLPTGGGPTNASPILVRRGEVVIYSAYVSARRTSLWGDDAREFRPERWETPTPTPPPMPSKTSTDQANRPSTSSANWSSNPPSSAYFPFSLGPRICLGQDFAHMEVSYTLLRLLSAFPEIALPDDEARGAVGSEKQQLTLVLACGEGCRVRVR